MRLDNCQYLNEKGTKACQSYNQLSSRNYPFRIRAFVTAANINKNSSDARRAESICSPTQRSRICHPLIYPLHVRSVKSLLSSSINSAFTIFSLSHYNYSQYQTHITFLRPTEDTQRYNVHHAAHINGSENFALHSNMQNRTHALMTFRFSCRIAICLEHPSPQVSIAAWEPRGVPGSGRDDPVLMKITYRYTLSDTGSWTTESMPVMAVSMALSLLRQAFV